MTISGGEAGVTMMTDNSELPELLRGLALTLMIAPPVTERGKHISVTFSDGAKLLEELMIFSASGGIIKQIKGLSPELVRKDSGKRSALRGMFLGGGFLSVGKNDHMEFAFSGEALRDDAYALIGEVVSGAGRGMRGEKYTVHVKSKEKISDLLVYMGAQKAALEVQKAMVDSFMGKRAAAAQNCDVANIDRAVEAASRQIDAIEYIDSKEGLESLGDKLQTTAHLRRTYPEITMSELAEMLGVSKSCVSHRLEKLTRYAEKLRVYEKTDETDEKNER